MFLVLAAVVGTPFSYQGTLAPGRSLSVRDVNGSIVVRAGSGLTIHATKRANRGDPNAVTVRVDPTASGLATCVRYAENAQRRCDENVSEQTNHDNDTRVDFDITLPSGVILDAATVNGSIEARTEGPIDAASVNGSITTEGSDIRSVRTVNGSIRARVLGGSRDPLVARTVNGSVEIALPSGSGAEISARTLTGGITVPGITVNRPRFGVGASAEGRIGDGSRRISLETVNGSITVRRDGDRSPRRQASEDGS